MEEVVAMTDRIGIFGRDTTDIDNPMGVATTIDWYYPLSADTDSPSSIIIDPCCVRVIAPIKVSFDYSRDAWRIEREYVHKDEDGNEEVMYELMCYIDNKQEDDQ